MEDPLGRLPKKRSSSISDPPRFASPAVAALAGTGRGSGFKPRCEQCKRPVLSDQVEVSDLPRGPSLCLGSIEEKGSTKIIPSPLPTPSGAGQSVSRGALSV